jgi:hypothetical protein
MFAFLKSKKTNFYTHNHTYINIERLTFEPVYSILGTTRRLRILIPVG